MLCLLFCPLTVFKIGDFSSGTHWKLAPIFVSASISENITCHVIEKHTESYSGVKLLQINTDECNKCWCHLCLYGEWFVRANSAPLKHGYEKDSNTLFQWGNVFLKSWRLLTVCLLSVCLPGSQSTLCVTQGPCCHYWIMEMKNLPGSDRLYIAAPLFFSLSLTHIHTHTHKHRRCQPHSFACHSDSTHQRDGYRQ